MSVENCCKNSKNPFQIAGAKWIWPVAFSEKVNQYVEFRQAFELEKLPTNVKLYISTDTEYAVWVNGCFVNFGQYHDFPDDKTYDTLDITNFLKAGNNIVAVLGYYQGEQSFQYLKGDPDLIYAVLVGDEAVCASGEGTAYRVSKSYVNGKIARITPQLGFTFEYNAAGEDNWREVKYTQGVDWNNIADGDTKPLESRKLERCRPIKKLEILDRLETKVVAQGTYKRLKDDSFTVAEQMQSDALSMVLCSDICGGHNKVVFPSADGIPITYSSSTKSDGVYIVLDLGREEAGIFEIDIDVPQETVIDVAWGEHLDDLRVRASVGGRNFAGKMKCRPGRQVFTHYFRRMAGRYLQLHIKNPADGTKIYYAGLKPTEYPLQCSGSFISPDKLQEKIFDVAVRTLHLCMHEHYEDCPWREQALYGMDSRNQALTGYYCFGEYDFPAASFKLLGDSLQEDGYQELCAPMVFVRTIPSFSMAWIVETAEQYLHSGSIDTAKSAYPTVKKMMDIYIPSMIDGIFPCPVGERFWQFYDWADGLHGSLPGDAGAFDANEQRIDSTLNGFFALALMAAFSLASACGFTEDAQKYKAALDELKENFHSKFWDEEVGAYLTSLSSGFGKHAAELPQALAILAGLAPIEIAAKLREKLASENNGLIETTLSQSLYKFEALLQDPQKYAPWVFCKISKDWSYMLQQGATSFWETIKGGDDFGNAGSLCHGWSGTPAYLYLGYLLGIRPTSPGFKTFKFEPISNVIESASGTVPTPYGCIEVSWKKVGGELQYELNHPNTIEAKIVLD